MVMVQKTVMMKIKSITIRISTGNKNGFYVFQFYFKDRNLKFLVTIFEKSVFFRPNNDFHNFFPQQIPKKCNFTDEHHFDSVKALWTLSANESFTTFYYIRRVNMSETVIRILFVRCV